MLENLSFPAQKYHMEVIFHLCYSCRSHRWCCCHYCCWEPRLPSMRRGDQWDNTNSAHGNNCEIHLNRTQISLNAFIVISCSLSVSFVLKHGGILHTGLIFVPKENASWATKNSPCKPNSLFSLSKCKTKKKKKMRLGWAPAKNTQFSDRQMTSCCHLISFLA